MFDFCDYSKYSEFFHPVKKKVVGKIKDEVKKNIICELVELKSKMYSLVTVDKEEIKKAKAVNKRVVKNIRHNEYIDVLFNKSLIKQNENESK